MDTTEPELPEYDFALILTGVNSLTSAVEDALFEAGCDDATLSVQHGAIYLSFTRSAPSLKHAILGAIENVRRAGIGAEVQRVDVQYLVSMAEIARRIGRTRQLIHQYVIGTRGPGGFPAPACNLANGTPLWDWVEVSRWLSHNDMIRSEEHQNAAVVAAINNALEQKQQHDRDPELVADILRVVGRPA